MTETLLLKYSASVPRYTSYPTAPHFHEGVGAGKYAEWLEALAPGRMASLYLHIPYCDRLCWFCACHTKHTLKYEPIAAYLGSLKREISLVADHVKPGVRITAVHFGGGSPTMVKPDDMRDLMAHLRACFTFDPDAEISVEMDPNDLDGGRYEALADIGMTRASLGIQDFNPLVQKSINRLQTFEQTKSVVDAVRARGVRSVNCDILYGLPHQTVDSVEATVRDILSLDPDRIALFGYAHVPWMKKHQTVLPDNALPVSPERYRQMQRAADILVRAGYEPIGIDHFARPGDSMAEAARNGTLRRNFQGYSVDAADALIGFGASSIGQFPQGHVQNIVATGEYERRVDGGALAIARGIELSADDRLRAEAIERLMCRFRLDFNDLRAVHGALAEDVIAEARDLAAGDRDGVVALDSAGFRITDTGRPFARTIAAHFDTYLSNGRGRHSVAV